MCRGCRGLTEDGGEKQLRRATSLGNGHSRFHVAGGLYPRLANSR